MLPQSGGVVTNVPLYVRLAGTAVGNVSGTITISSTGALAQNVAVTGVVTTSPNPGARVTSISPFSGSANAPIVIHFYGTDFIAGAIATFGPSAAISAPTTFISATHVTAQFTFPGVSVPTQVYCHVNNPAPGGGSNTFPGTILFTILPGQATITSFFPTIGLPGTFVSIYGTGFINQANNDVLFNGIPANLVGTPTSTQLYVRVPAGATTGPITVTTAGGSAVSTTPFIVPPVFFEDFETGTKTSYVPASVPLFTMGWTLGEALIGTTAGVDKFNGTRSARLRGGGFVEMDVDKPNGAGMVTVSAATYATETGASFIPEISTDGGMTYTSLLGSSPALRSPARSRRIPSRPTGPATCACASAAPTRRRPPTRALIWTISASPTIGWAPPPAPGRSCRSWRFSPTRPTTSSGAWRGARPGAGQPI